MQTTLKFLLIATVSIMTIGALATMSKGSQTQEINSRHNNIALFNTLPQFSQGRTGSGTKTGFVSLAPDDVSRLIVFSIAGRARSITGWGYNPVNTMAITSSQALPIHEPRDP